MKLTHPKKRINLIGQRFGKLVVVRKAAPYKCPKTGKNIRRKWRCQCDCGKKTSVVTSKLRNGHTRSCGCLYTETRNRLPSGTNARNIVYARYRRVAERKKLPFNLTIENFELLTKSNCYYCNSFPANAAGKNTYTGVYIYNGIDRLNNNMGYELNNCVPACKRCNIAKNTQSEDEFYSWINNIVVNRNLLC